MATKKEAGKSEFRQIKMIGSVENGTGRYDVRIVEVREKRYIDVRKYVISDEYKGYTKQGMMLPKKTCREVSKLMKQARMEI